MWCWQRGVGLSLALFWSTPAAAQLFGQWSWDARIGYSQRVYKNLVNEAEMSSFEQRDLEFSVGVNGFVIHPAVAKFRIGVDGLISAYEAQHTVDTDRWGLRGDLNLFPTGKYPVRLFITRQLYDYSTPQEDLMLVPGNPDTFTTWGGRLRLRDGILKGALLGFERTSIDFLDPEADQELNEREFVAWSRAGESGNRHFRLERRFHEFGTVDFKTDDVIANFNQQDRISPSWTWNLSTTATHRTLGFDGRDGSSYETGRIRNQFIHTTRGNDLVTLSYSASLFRSPEAPFFQSHYLMARYRWKPKPRWEISPFSGFGIQTSANRNIRSPQVGISANWHRSGTLDLTLSNRASYALVQRLGSVDAGTDTLVGLDAGATLGHGNGSGLRKEVEGSWSRNQLRLGEEALVELPRLGVPLVGGASEDMIRGRVTLRGRWRSLTMSGYSEWSRRVPTGLLETTGFAADNQTHTVQISGARFRIVANFGKIMVLQPSTQNVQYRIALFSIRPWRLLALRASYRVDSRRLILAPDVEGSRISAGAELRLGAFDIRVNGFMDKEHLIERAERTNRGVSWSISRGFSGWLPIVSRGPSRRRGR